MLYGVDNINRICCFLEILRSVDSNKSRAGVPVVLDPIMRSSSGRELIDSKGIALMQERLLPLVDWVTPNITELSVLSGVPVESRDDLPRASRILQEQVARRAGGGRIGVFATGGHLDPPDDLLLLPNGDSHWLAGERVVTRATHGTGCTLSSAFLSRLVLGDSPQQAAQSAKSYISGALESSSVMGSGFCGINHLWRLHQP
jgi:hydroxymethylpyrimidine/phosphomethylpyrimidine kinase